MNKEMFEDFHKVLEEIDNPLKGGKAQYGAYATLIDVVKAVKPVLLKHNFVFTQNITPLGLETHLVHKDGDVLTSTFPINTNLPPQQVGMQITYYRRYALCALLGIMGEDDKDGDLDNKDGHLHVSTPQAKPLLQPKPAFVAGSANGPNCSVCNTPMRRSEKTQKWYCANFKDGKEHDRPIPFDKWNPEQPSEFFGPETELDVL